MNNDVRTPFVVDLIGDLDSTLVASLTETLASLTDNGPADVLLSTRHLSIASSESLQALDVALIGARSRGSSIAIDPGNRKMRLAFSTAQIDCSSVNVPRPIGARHYMIARHASPAKLRRSA